MPDKTKRVAVLVDDMFFAAKINSAASETGSQVQRIKSRQELEQLASDPPSLVIVDLNSDRISPLGAIAILKSIEALAGIPIVAFVSHVQTELIRQAQSAGCDHVIARSAFAQLLPRIVAGDLGGLK